MKLSLLEGKPGQSSKDARLRRLTERSNTRRILAMNFRSSVEVASAAHPCILGLATNGAIKAHRLNPGVALNTSLEKELFAVRIGKR